MTTLEETIVNPEEVSALEAAKQPIVKKPDLSPTEQIAQITAAISDIQSKMTRLSESVGDTKTKFNTARGELGLSPTNEALPSTSSEEDTIKKLQEEHQQLLEQKEGLLSQQNGTEKAPVTLEGEEVGDKKETLPENKEPEQEKKPEQISENTLARLSEAMGAKRVLEAKVGVLKEAPEFQKFEEVNKELDEKRKRLEELKKPVNSSGTGAGGSVSINGNVSVNIEGNTAAQPESDTEKSKIDLEKEAENLLAKTGLEILKLEKEEIEYSPEGLAIKMGKLEIESKKIEAETAIWNIAGMDQKKFGETLQKINKTEGEPAENVENKELFLKFKEIDDEMKAYEDGGENKDFYQSIEDKQKEIDEREKTVGDSVSPNESAVLKILDTYEKGEAGKEDNADKEKPIEQKEADKAPEEVPVEKPKETVQPGAYTEESVDSSERYVNEL